MKAVFRSSAEHALGFRDKAGVRPGVGLRPGGSMAMLCMMTTLRMATAAGASHSRPANSCMWSEIIGFKAGLSLGFEKGFVETRPALGVVL